MTTNEILEVINKSLNSVLEHNNFTLSQETTAKDVDGWDSITHMLIINNIENALNIKFKLLDLIKMNNIGDLIATIKSELEAK